MTVSEAPPAPARLTSAVLAANRSSVRASSRSAAVSRASSLVAVDAVANTREASLARRPISLRGTIGSTPSSSGSEVSDGSDERVGAGGSGVLTAKV